MAAHVTIQTFDPCDGEYCYQWVGGHYDECRHCREGI